MNFLHRILSRSLCCGCSSVGLVAAFLVATASDAKAQFELGQSLDVGGTYLDGGALEATDGVTLTGYRFSADYNQPLGSPRPAPWAASLGLEAEYTRLDFSRASRFSMKDLDLYKFELPLQVLYVPERYMGKWFFAGLFEPGVASDLRGFSFDDISLRALAAAYYKVSDSLSFGVGGYYSTDFGDPIILPSVGVIWDIDDRLTLRVTLPTANLSYDVTDALTSSLFVGPSGGNWHVRDTGTRDGEYVSTSAWLAGVRFNYELSEHAALTISSAYSFGARYEINDDDGDKVDGTDVDGFFTTQVGLRWNF